MNAQAPRSLSRSFRVPILAGAAGLLLSLTAAAGPVRLAREPAPSPDGSRIAFSWHGDIFVGPATGGRAERLTVHPAEDRRPAWSPDGSQLCFASNRHGHWDVFAMSAEGGELRRLTFHSGSDDQPVFSSDGREVVFASTRQVAFRQEAGLFRVPADGSADPQPETDFGAGSPALSPDGRRLAFITGRFNWARKRYRGSAATELWLREEDGELRRLTTHPGADDAPSWLNAREIAFRSDSSGTFNAWALDVQTGKRRQLTAFDDGELMSGLRAGGGLVAFERVDRLGLFELASGRTRELVFEAAEDSSERQAQTVSFSKDAEELSLSADGEQAAFVLRGEVFASRAEKEIVDPTAARVTRSPARDRHPAWFPDASSLIFSSDRHGSQDLFRARPRAEAPGSDGLLSRALAFDLERLTSSSEDDQEPRVSPDGTLVAFTRGRGHLVLLDLESGTERIRSPGWNLSGVSFSPDGRWLAFAREDDEFNSEIWIAEVEGEAPPVNVSQHPDNDDGPRWSANGRVIAYRARREGTDERVALVVLRAADAELSAEEREEAFKGALSAAGAGKGAGKDAGKDAGKTGDKDTGKGKAAAPPEVRIDFHRIHERTRLLAAMPGGGELAPSPDGLAVAFVARGLDGKRDLWSVRFDGSDTERLTKGGVSPSALHFSADGKSITFLDAGGSLKRIPAKGGSPDTLPFKARLLVDLAAERRQVFDEVWRRLGRDYYDPAMHGADWAALRERHAPLAELALGRVEFQDVIRRLLGELNSSHLGIRGGGEPGPSETTGELGIGFETPRPGEPGWRIARIVRDAPADSAAAALTPGARVLAIDDFELTETTRLHELLAGRAGERVRLRVSAPGRGRGGNRRGLPSGGGSHPREGAIREVVLRPISPGALSNLLYEEWVAERRAQAEGLSQGRVGFLHVRSMNVPSLERFEQELYAVAHGREAIVIDVRNNGGGWTADFMLAILNARRHATTVPRGGGEGYPQGRRPLYAWQKPVAALCNEGSFSNAEIFSHAMKTLKRGPLVGMPTPGGVISTGGTRLLDGSFLRLPFRGWWNAATGLDMEGNGAVPDQLVPRGPEEQRQGRDPQLERAVELLVAELDRSGGAAR